MTDLSTVSDAELIAMHKSSRDPFARALEAEGATGPLADVAKSIYQQESGSGSNTKTSNAGAVGGMQIVPSTFKGVADPGWDINNPEHNARAGIRYVKQMYDLAGGDPALTATGYYGGPGGLAKAQRGVAVSDPRNPKAPTTLEYGQQVAGRMKAQKGTIASALDKATDVLIPSAKADESAPVNPLSSLSDEELRTMYDASRQAPSAPIQPMAQQAAPERSASTAIGRQLALTGRAAVSGVAALPAMASDAITGPINAGLDLVRGEGNGFRFQKAGQALNNIMDGVGVAKPEDATERVVQDAAGAMAGAGGFAAAGTAIAGGALSRAASTVAGRIGQSMAAGQGLQVGSAATGAGASGMVRENGGGEGAQLVAGLAGGFTPAAGAFAGKTAMRTALRGGEAGRQAVADNIAAFKGASGELPTIGQATGSRTLQAVETGLSNVVGGSSVMIRKGERQAEALSHSVQDLTEALAPNASGADAGEAITRGVTAFKDNVKVTQAKLYAKLDEHIPSQAPVMVSKTREALAALGADIEGAPSLSGFFKNAKITGIDRALVSDLETALAAKAPSGANSAIWNSQPPSLDEATLPYVAIKKLRTLVGRELAYNNFASDVPRSKWSALYGALSDDLGDVAKASGPQAEQAWDRANKFTRLSMERLDQLSTVVNRDAPEKIFKAATTGLGEGATTISRVMKSLPQENRREVTAAVLKRLGRAKPGQQNEVGDAFSSETFLTNLSAMTPEAKSALFGSSGYPQLEDKIAQMARMAAVRRDGAKVFANPSGTARQTALLGWLGTLLAGFSTGNSAAITGALAAPVLANGGARFMTSAKGVQRLAEKVAIHPGTAAAAVEAVSRPTQAPTPDEQAVPRIELRGMAEPGPTDAAPAIAPAQQPPPSAATPTPAAPRRDYSKLWS